MGYDMCGRNGNGYFRLNIGGMSTMCQILDVLEVLSHETGGDWPKTPAGLPGNWFDEEVQETNVIAREFREELDRCLSFIGEPGKVSLEKFSSNDGWIVTSVECEWLARALTGLTDDQISIGLQNDRITDEMSDFYFDGLLEGRRRPSHRQLEEHFDQLDLEELRPSADEITEWREICDEFRSFCETCAEGDGFEVR